MGNADGATTDLELLPMMDFFPNDVRPGAPTTTVGDAETRLNMMCAVVWVVAQTTTWSRVEWVVSRFVVSRLRGREVLDFWRYLSLDIYPFCPKRSKKP